MGPTRADSVASREDTPLMRQWREAKLRHPDALLFFRVGDFYELFRQDAEEGSRPARTYTHFSEQRGRC